MLEPLTPDLPVFRRPFLRLLHEAASALGGTVEVEPAFGQVGQVRLPGRPPRLFRGAALGLNSDAAAAWARDKDHCARRLRAAGVAAPDGVVLSAPRFRAALARRNPGAAAALPDPATDARRFAEEAGWPVWLKPLQGAAGEGVMRIDRAEDLERGLEAVFAHADQLRLEAALPGRDLRVNVLRGAVVAAFARRPAEVVGDGRSDVATLTARLQQALRARHGGVTLSVPEGQGSRVLAVGECLALSAAANLTTGGTLEDLTDRLSQNCAALAIRAAEVLGLEWAGVDLMVAENRPAVLEVNAAPGLEYYASHGPEQWARACGILIRALEG